MSRRSIAWVIFLGFLVLVAAGGVLDVGNRVVQYGVCGFWLVLTAGFVWAYAHTRSPVDRQRLIDTRGVNLLPQPLRRWLFDE